MQTVVYDPASGQYVVYDENGVEITRYGGGANLSWLSGTVPSGGTSQIGDDGKAVAPQGQPRDPLAPAPQGATNTSTPAGTEIGSEIPAADWTGTTYTPRSGYRGGGGWYARGGGGGYSTGVDYGFGAPADFGMGQSGQAGVPRYADGTTHQFFGGPPRIPGGHFAQQGDMGGGPEQVFVPGGAAAGPFATRAARNDPPRYDGFKGGVDPRAYDRGDRGPQPGGGSGNQHPLYAKLSAKGNAIEAKVRGMAAGIGSGGGGDSTGTGYSDPFSTRQYRRQGRRMDRAYERYGEQLEDPDPLPVHGWVKQQGFKPGTVEAALGDPTMLLTEAIPGFEAGFGPVSDAFTSLPMTDLALITSGTQSRRGLMTKTPVVKPPKILRREAGLKPEKPDYKRTLDPAATANRVAEMWKELTAPVEPAWRDTEFLLGNLATAKPRSALRQGITQQFDENPSAALESIRSYLMSAMAAGGDSVVGRSRMKGVDNRITNLGPDLLRMQPKKASGFVSTLARSYLE